MKTAGVPPVWSETRSTFPVPTGEWLHIETQYRMGGRDSGRIRFAVTDSGGVRTPIFDITNWTYDPAADTFPVRDRSSREIIELR